MPLPTVVSQDIKQKIFKAIIIIVHIIHDILYLHTINHPLKCQIGCKFNKKRLLSIKYFKYMIHEKRINIHR